MAVYDLENLVFDIGDLIKNNLNTEIGLINTEKNDGITCPTLATEAFFVQSMNEKENNHSPFCFVGIHEIEAQSMAGVNSKDTSIVAIVQAEDANNDKDIIKKMFRYGRALEQVAQKRFKNLNNVSPILVKNIPVTDIIDWNSSKRSKFVGLQLSTSLA